MVFVEKVAAREVLDSRGNPTVEGEVKTRKGVFRAIVPSGASTGTHEALEMRDGGKRFGGKGVLKAVGYVNGEIAGKVCGKDWNQKELDAALIKLDGTPTKSRLGANAILSVSLAFAVAAAAEEGISLYEYCGELSGRNANTLPIPQLNVLNGGKHAGFENDVQEQMFMPVGAKNFHDALQMGAECYQTLQKLLKKSFGASAIHLGDEGGFAPTQLKNVEERLEWMQKAVDEAGYAAELRFALDPASSEFFGKSVGKYRLGEKTYSSAELVDYYKNLVSQYKIVSIEDGMSEEDWSGWQLMNKELGHKIQIVGDDVLVTNVERIKKAIAQDACNALLLKVNQIGTLSESIDAANLSFKNNWNVVVSHRSGETEDSFIADLVVGLSAGQSKFGGPARSERTCKYNQLLRIEEALGSKAVYGGRIIKFGR